MRILRQYAVQVAVFMLLSLVLAATLLATIAFWPDVSRILTGRPVRDGSLTLLPPIVIGSGVAIAALAYFRDHSKFLADRQWRISEKRLEIASSSLDVSVSILTPVSNDRVIWIRAARTLLQALQHGERLEIPEHREQFRLACTNARDRLFDALHTQDPETKAPRALPPQFFFGIPDWPECNDIDAAAIRGGSKAVSGFISMSSLPPIAEMSQLQVESVVAIYDFIRYPTDFSDPLDEVSIWEESWETSYGFDAGARRYAAHRKKYIAAGGKLIEMDKPE